MDCRRGKARNGHESSHAGNGGLWKEKVARICECRVGCVKRARIWECCVWKVSSYPERCSIPRLLWCGKGAWLAAMFPRHPQVVCVMRDAFRIMERGMLVIVPGG